MKMWFVAESTPVKTIDDAGIGVVGIFSSKARAIKACYNEMCWIAPLEVNRAAPREPTAWPGACYPLADKSC